MTHKLTIKRVVTESDVIKTVVWRLDFTDTDNQYIGWEEGLADVTPEDINSIVPFDLVTEADLTAWTEAKLDIDSFYAAAVMRLAQEQAATTPPKEPEVRLPPWQGGEPWEPRVRSGEAAKRRKA